MTTADAVPVADDLFRRTGEGAALVGSRCSGCDAHYFPTSLSCRNPACDDKDVTDVLLGGHGTLYSYTVQAYRPPALFRLDPFAPYAIGLVDLPEGLRVLGKLTGCALDEIHIGMPVALTVEKLYADDEGRDVLTYAYAPA